MTGHVPEFGGHDAETAGHDGPKYAAEGAGDARDAFLAALQRENDDGTGNVAADAPPARR